MKVSARQRRDGGGKQGLLTSISEMIIQPVGEHIPINLAVGVTSTQLMGYYFLSRYYRSIVSPQCEVIQPAVPKPDLSTSHMDNASYCLWVFARSLQEPATVGILMDHLQLGHEHLIH